MKMTKRVRSAIFHVSCFGLAAFAASGCNGLLPADDPGKEPIDADPTPTAKPVIATVMGTGFAGNNGEMLDALQTQLYLPQDLAFGPDGALYVVDWNNHRLRRLNPDGTVQTIAGTGELSGDDYESGSPGTTVKLNHPTNICFDNQGRMIISAWHNSALKRYDLETDYIENFAGVGGRTFGGDGGPVSKASLNLPSSAVVNSINEIIFSDQANQRIRSIDINGVVHTICGDGVAGFAGDGGRSIDARINSPSGQAAQPGGRIAIDRRTDEIYIADTWNHRIRMIDSAGYIHTVVGNGTATYAGDGGDPLQASLNTPSDIEVGPDGTLYIADTLNHAIRMVDPDRTKITTIAGNGTRGFSGDGGPADAAQLDRPYGVCLAPNGDLYIADTYNNRIRRMTLDAVEAPVQGGSGFSEVEVIPCSEEVGSICTYAGTGDRGFNGDGLDRRQTALYWPFDIEFTPSGRIYVNDWNNHKIRWIREDQTFEMVIGAGIGDGPDDFSDLLPTGALGKETNLNHATDMLELPTGELLVTVWHNHKYRLFDPTNGRVYVLSGREPGARGDGGPFKDARVDLPAHSILDPRGNLITIVQKNWSIRIVRDFVNLRGDGIIETIAGTGTSGYNGDGLPPIETQFGFPGGPNPECTGGLVMDDQGYLYIADTENHRIRRIEFFDDEYKTGIVTTIGGTGEPGFSGDGGPASNAQINFPQDMELGPDGRLYFADTDNNRVRVIDLNTGIISTVAGAGTKGYSGDGGQAINAELNRPFGLAFDLNGDLYISDTFNGRIRKVKMSY